MGIASLICSGKGGVGKSTTTVGLGRALAGRGKKVLLVDCDAGLRTLDRMTSVDENLVYDISDVINGNCTPIQAIYKVNDCDNLYVIPASNDYSDMVEPKIMKQFVDLLKKYYDHVILDSPAGIGRGFQSAAIGADRAFVVCTPDPVCLRSSVKIKNLLSDMGIHNTRLIINRYSKEYFQTITDIEDLDKVIDLAETRLYGVIPEDKRLSAAFFRGNSVNSEAMLAYKRVSARLEGEKTSVLL